jgi:hypothetical protein
MGTKLCSLASHGARSCLRKFMYWRSGVCNLGPRMFDNIVLYTYGFIWGMPRCIALALWPRRTGGLRAAFLDRLTPRLRCLTMACNRNGSARADNPDPIGYS